MLRKLSTNLMTTSSVAASLRYSPQMVIVLNNLGILPGQRVQHIRVFTPDDVREFHRRVRAVKRAGKTLKEWREVIAAK